MNSVFLAGTTKCVLFNCPLIFRNLNHFCLQRGITGDVFWKFTSLKRYKRGLMWASQNTRAFQAPTAGSWVCSSAGCGRNVLFFSEGSGKRCASSCETAPEQWLVAGRTHARGNAAISAGIRNESMKGYPGWQKENKMLGRGSPGELLYCSHQGRAEYH